MYYWKKKIKRRKAAGLDEIPTEVQETREFDDVRASIMQHCQWAKYNREMYKRLHSSLSPPKIILESLRTTEA